jgi:hypothetical protein
LALHVRMLESVLSQALGTSGSACATATALLVCNRLGLHD